MQASRKNLGEHMARDLRTWHVGLDDVLCSTLGTHGNHIIFNIVKLGGMGYKKLEMR